MIQKFCFDPCYQGLPQDENDKTPRIIFLCGHNGYGRQQIQKVNAPDRKVVVFDFPNIGRNCSSLWKLRSENTGGTHDAQVALYSVIKCADNECPIILSGLSRGGAAVITLLHMLSFPDEYKHIWGKFGVTKGSDLDYEKIDKIKKQIKKVYIDNPFLSLQTVFGPFIGKVARVMLPFIAKFDFHEPRTLLDKLIGQDWIVDIRVALRDYEVGNRFDDELKALCEGEPGWNFFKVNQGHCEVSTTRENIKNYCFVDPDSGK